MIKKKTVKEYLQEYDITKEQSDSLSKYRRKVGDLEKEMRSFQKLGLTQEESQFIEEDSLDGFVAVLEGAVKEFKGVMPDGLISAAIQFNLNEDIYFLDESFKDS